jgi:hypothetical protein
MLVVDVGETSVKILATGQSELRGRPIAGRAGDCMDEAASIDYPGPVLQRA